MRLKSAVTCLCLILILGCAKGTSVTATRLAVGDKAPSFALADIFGGPIINSAKIVHNSNATVIVIWSGATLTRSLTDMPSAWPSLKTTA